MSASTHDRTPMSDESTPPVTDDVLRAMDLSRLDPADTLTYDRSASALNRYCWRISRGKATAEAIWVARQSGHRIDGGENSLRWMDENGIVRAAAVRPGHHRGWDLQLQALTYTETR